MENGFAAKPLLEAVPGYRDELKALREIILANAVMVGEVAAPTFGEERRMRFVADRFTENDLQNISVDEAGNASAILPGRNKEADPILVVAHGDTVFPDTVDHTVTVGTNHVTGPGIADNSLGVAVAVSLPPILERLQIELERPLVIVAATRGLGRGNLEGLNFFLDHIPFKPVAGVCIEGIHLGRLSYASLGLLRGEIDVSVPFESPWELLGRSSAVITLNKIITNLLAIPIPQEPRTSINLGSVAAGTGFATNPQKALLRFEARSEEVGRIGAIHEAIEEIVAEVNAETDSSVALSVIARRKPGGIGFNHPLVTFVRDVMGALEIKPKTAPSTGELSALLDRDIPGVTLGLTTGRKRHQPEETIEVNPIFSGVAQLAAILQAIDQGVCDA